MAPDPAPFESRLYRIARAMLWTGAGVVLGVLTVVAVMSW